MALFIIMITILYVALAALIIWTHTLSFVKSCEYNIIPPTFIKYSGKNYYIELIHKKHSQIATIIIYNTKFDNKWICKSQVFPLMCFAEETLENFLDTEWRNKDTEERQEYIKKISTIILEKKTEEGEVKDFSINEIWNL